MAILDADGASSSEDADGDNDDDVESLALFRANGTMILDRSHFRQCGCLVDWCLHEYISVYISA